MKRPSGAVTARTTAKNRRICSQPFRVMTISYAGPLSRAAASELFRPKERVREVHEQSHRHEKTDHLVECHGALLQPIAGGDVRRREDEKHDCDDDEQRIHGGSY